MIIMARILTPDDYGLIGMLAVFISVSQSLVDSGFSQALIRKLDRSETDNSTVFYFNIGVGTILYLILFFCAPLIAGFYGEPSLIPLTRVISLSVLINSFVVVQRALLTINIDFKTQAKASMAAAIISGAVGIAMAYTGFGVWAIVWQQLTSLTVNVGLLWLLSGWRPMLAYSWRSFRELFGFGSKLALSGIINTLYNNISILIIGKVFKASDLGYYTRAYQFASFPSSNITGIIQRVTYPILCTIQDDDVRLSDVYRRFLRLSAFIVFPLMIGLGAVARPFINLILTEKWDFTAELLPVVCLGMMWYPIHSINLNLLQVKGRSDLFLKLEIWKKIIGIVILGISIPFGLIALCWGNLVSSIVSLIINTHYMGKLIQLGFLKQLKDLMPTLLLSITMGMIVYMTVTYIHMESWMALGVGVLEGFLIYLGIAKLLHFPEFHELISLLRRG